MKLDPVHPASWRQPRGYSNAILVSDAKALLFVAGQIAWDADQRLVGAGDFAAQFRQALDNVCTLVRAGGGYPADLVRLTIYVTDKRLYLEHLQAVGAAYRDLVGRHYPAMALVQVGALLEDGALIEIEATAAIG